VRTTCCHRHPAYLHETLRFIPKLFHPGLSLQASRREVERFRVGHPSRRLIAIIDGKLRPRMEAMLLSLLGHPTLVQLLVALYPASDLVNHAA
jgi:hypothetical protein